MRAMWDQWRALWKWSVEGMALRWAKKMTIRKQSFSSTDYIARFDVNVLRTDRGHAASTRARFSLRFAYSASVVEPIDQTALNSLLDVSRRTSQAPVRARNLPRNRLARPQRGFRIARTRAIWETLHRLLGRSRPSDLDVTPDK